MSLVNWDYLNIFKEPPLMLAALVRHALRPAVRTSSTAELIVNTCLIGEFAGSAPALGVYLASCKGPVDLLVSPPLRSLAERMRGVRHVYVAKSVFARAIEQHESAQQEFDTYQTVTLMRISRDSYRVLGGIHAAHLKTSFSQISLYGFHLAHCWLKRTVPLSWREVNFAMLAEKPKPVTFDKIFDVPIIQPDPAVLIHTGASWQGNFWPLERWVELLKKMYVPGRRFVFVGSKRDLADYEHIASQLPFAVESLIGKLDLLQLAQRMRAASLMIAVDSGPRNVAHLVGLRSITLLGPGPHMHTPEDSRDIVLDYSRGRGVFQRFFATTHNRLIDAIEPAEVAAAARSLLT